MNRTYGREVVFGTFKSFGVEPQALTKKTKLSSVIGQDVRVDFVKQLNERLPGGKKLDASHGYLTVGQLVNMASTLPGGKDPTSPFPWKKPIPK